MSSPGGQEVGRVSIRVLPDTSDFRRRLRGDLERATAGMEARVPINVDLDTAGVTARMRALMGQLRAQAAGGVDVNVGVDRSQLSAVSSLFRGLQSNAGGASSFQMPHGLVQFVAYATILGPALSLVSGLLAGLPSVLAAVGVGAGAVVLGFDGIKKAASSFGEPIAALKDALSAKFENRLTPVFNDLARSLPSMKGGFLTVADGLSDMASGFVGVVTSAAGMKEVQSILKGTGSLFSQMKPFVKDFTTGLLTLGGRGASAFTYLATTMNRFGQGFNDAVQRVANDGSLYRAFKGLADVTDGIGDAFNRVFEAGIRSMPALGTTVRTVLQQMGRGLADAMPGLVAFGNLVFVAFGFLSRAFGGFMKGVGPALTRLASQLTTDLALSGDEISRYSEMFGQKIGGLIDWIREKIPQAEKIIHDFFAALSGRDPKGNGIGDQVGSKIREFFTWIKNFWDENGDQIIAGVGALVGAITNAAPAIATFVGYFASAAGFIGSAKDRLQGFIDTLANFGADTVSPIVRRMGDAFNFVKTAVQNALSAVSNFVSSAVSSLQSAGSQMLSAIQTAWSAIVNTVNQKIGEVVSAVTALGGKITSALSGLAGQMVSIGVQIIQGLINGITSMAQSVASAAAGVVKGAINAAKSALGIHSPSKVFAEFGRYSAVGYINGLEGEGSGVDKAGDRFGNRVADSLRKQVPTIDQAWSDALEQAKVGEIPGKFFEAAGSELLSDIGISTDGALGELVKQITQNNNNSTTTYIVQDLDEAQRKERNKQRKESLQHTRR